MNVGLLTLPLTDLEMVTIERRKGVVRSIAEGTVVVRIQQQSACSGCHAKEFCCSTDCAERDVVVRTDTTDYQPGDAVIVEGQDSVGRLAVLLSFVIPIILFVGSLAVGIKLLALGEGWAIALATATLALYYILLRLLEPRLGRVLKFEITKAV